MFTLRNTIVLSRFPWMSHKKSIWKKKSQGKKYLNLQTQNKNNQIFKTFIQEAISKYASYSKMTLLRKLWNNFSLVHFIQLLHHFPFPCKSISLASSVCWSLFLPSLLLLPLTVMDSSLLDIPKDKDVPGKWERSNMSTAIYYIYCNQMEVTHPSRISSTSSH